MNTYRVRKFLGNFAVSRMSSSATEEQKNDIRRLAMRLTDAEAERHLKALIATAMSPETKAKLQELLD